MAKVTLQNYGSNQGAAPASLKPDQDVTRSPYAPNLSEAAERIVARGIASNATPAKINTRADANVPAAYGHRDRSADPAVKIAAKTSRR